MRKNALARLAATAAAAIIAVTGLTASARAADTGTITGILTTYDGAPVGGATVTVSPWAPSVTTAADGRYTVTNLTPGQYRVQFDPQNGVNPVQFAHDGRSWNEATLFQVNAGAITTVDESLLQPAAFTGRFTDAGGTGLAGVSVYADSADAMGGHATTAADGSYSMPVLPGSYRISFARPQGTQYAHGTLDWTQATLFTVASGQTKVVDETQLPVGSIHGQVNNADGSPAANLSVTATGDYGQTAGVLTDGTGGYTIANLYPGRYRVKVRLPSGQEQWAPQTLRSSQATRYDVAAGGAITVDLTILATGSVSGRFSTGGVGTPGVFVSLDADGVNSALSTTTDANGDYHFASVLIGAYKVSFNDWSSSLQQYAFGRLDAAQADPITVNAGANTQVDDSRLPTGTVRVTARDSVTGALIQTFWVQLRNLSGATSNGVADLANVPIGIHTVEVNAEGYQSGTAQVTVQSGQMSAAEVSLAPDAKIPVTVVDAVTGAPVPGVCIDTQRAGSFYASDGCGPTDGQGKATLYAPTGDYQLFVYAADQSPYGAQWFGTDGRGTGDQREAKVFHLTNGQNASAVLVKLDHAGTISGTVTSETGDPLLAPSYFIATSHPSLGTGYYAVQPDGHYTINWLGPYSWPIGFTARGHASQWSGGTANRFEAQTVKVNSGATTTYNYTLKTGTTVTGTVAMPGNAPVVGRVVAFNATTGDVMGAAEIEEGKPYTLRVLGSQPLKLQFQLLDNVRWMGGTSIGNARLIRVGTGTLTLDVCVAADGSVDACVIDPTRRPIPSNPLPGTPIPPRRH